MPFSALSWRYTMRQMLDAGEFAASSRRASNYESPTFVLEVVRAAVDLLVRVKEMIVEMLASRSDV